MTAAVQFPAGLCLGLLALVLADTVSAQSASGTVEFTAEGQSTITVRVRRQHRTPCSDGSRATVLSIAWHLLPPLPPIFEG